MGHVQGLPGSSQCSPQACTCHQCPHSRDRSQRDEAYGYQGTHQQVTGKSRPVELPYRQGVVKGPVTPDLPPLQHCPGGQVVEAVVHAEGGESLQ